MRVVRDASMFIPQGLLGRARTSLEPVTDVIDCDQPLIFLLSHSSRARVNASGEAARNEGGSRSEKRISSSFFPINLECTILLFRSPRVALWNEGRPLAVY